MVEAEIQFAECSRLLKIEEAKDLIFTYQKNSAVSISGGKDSLVLMDLAFNCGLDRFVYSDTTMDLKATYDYIDTLETYYGIRIERVRAPRDFFDVAKDIIFPSRKLRWCCDVFKFGPIANYIKDNNVKYFFTGLRRDESYKRKDYESVSKNPLIPAVQVNPIIDFSEEEVWNYIDEHHLPVNPAYKQGYKRLGCWPCPYKTETEWAILQKNDPLLIQKMKLTIEDNINKYGNLGYKDKVDYIDSYGWVSNAPPLRNIYVGEIEKQWVKGENGRHHFVYLIKLNSEEDLKKALKNILLIQRRSKYMRVDNEKLQIEIHSLLDIQKIVIYLEKQFNCVGCGACRPLCDKRAIFVEDGTYKIDFTKCRFCLKCLKTTIIRGACIARNYKPVRKCIKKSDLDDEIRVLTSFSPCGDNQIGLIRSRKSIDVLKTVIVKFVEERRHELPMILEFQESIVKKKNPSPIINILNNETTFTIKRVVGFTEVEIKSLKSLDLELYINDFLDEFQ